MSWRNAVWIWIIAIIASSLSCAAARDFDQLNLPPDTVQALHSDGKATLYSLDPDMTRVDLLPTFHHWPVLGKSELDSDQKKVAVQSFDQAIAVSSNSFSHCFAPRHALRIMWHGHFYDYLLCYTCGGLEVDRDGKVLALAGVPSGSPLELNDLMTRLKLPLAQSSQAWLADHARREAALANFRKNEQGWISAGPASLRTFMDLSLNQDAGDLLSKSHLQQMDASFKADVPDAKERIRQLLIWYGSARGTWAGYSPYEQTTEALLADYPTSLVAEVVAARASSSDALAEGAAHYFAGDEFMRRHPGDLRHLSPAIKALLLDHVLHSGDPQDGIRRYRATTAFKQGN